MTEAEGKGNKRNETSSNKKVKQIRGSKIKRRGRKIKKD